MADFRPETNIYLFEGTGVDEGNQPYFTNSAAKLSWYMAHPTIIKEAQSFQRENREYCRVADKAERLRHCDMMAFQNGENKWIFCAIDEIEFVNPNCSEIRYHVDYMQTYIEDIKFGPCWVEREMAENDWKGGRPSFDNLQPEGLETGALRRVNMDPTRTLELIGSKVVVLSALNKDAQPTITAYKDIDLFPHVINRYDFNLVDLDELGSMLSLYAERDKLSAIAAIYLIPDQSPQQTENIPINWNSVDGYQIVNSKVWSSEFFNFVIGNKQGQEVTLQPERFPLQDTLNLRIDSNFCDGTGGSVMYPIHYPSNPKGMSVFLPWNVQLAYAGDGWYNWLSQNAGSFAANAANTIVSGAFKGAFLGVPGAGAAIGAANLAMQALGKTIDSYMNPIYITSPGSGSGMNFAFFNIGFTCELQTPPLDIIKSIDEFFGRFGYRTNRFKVPNVNTRPKWNFVKTAGANVRGWFSKQAQDKIVSILNQGVTFWHLSPGEEITDDWTIEQNKE